jgi:hypothetical protein
MTWTQPVCENRFFELYPEKNGYSIVRVKLPKEEWEPCCFCRTPTNIYVRLDPATVPFPREEEP